MVAPVRPPGGAAIYRRREPEKTVLYQVLQEHLETFLARAEAERSAGLPALVERELRAFLAGGVLSRGFCRVRCTACGKDALVAFMFRGRGIMTCTLIYCALIVVACMGFIRNDRELDALTALGTGVMLVVSIPLTLLFGHQALRASHDHMPRLQSGAMRPPDETPPLVDVVEGRDV